MKEDPTNWPLLLFVGVVYLLIMLRVYTGVLKREMQRHDEAFKKEMDRRAKVKALYPDPVSYEERMGTNYGPEEEDDDESIL